MEREREENEEDALSPFWAERKVARDGAECRRIRSSSASLPSHRSATDSLTPLLNSEHDDPF